MNPREELGTTAEGRLQASLSLGRDKAKQSGVSVLVSFSWHLEQCVPPLCLLATARSLDQRCLFWARPEEKFWLIGVGSVAALQGAGVEAFSETSKAYRSLVANSVVSTHNDRGVGPIALGGFRFDPSQTRSALWKHFPDACLVVPQLLFTWSEDQRWVTLNFLVSGGTDIGNEMAAVFDLITLLSEAPVYDRLPSRPKLKKSDSASVWKSRVQEALRAIEDRRVSKVVLSRRCVLRGEQPFLLDLALARLCDGYPECALFSMDSVDSTFLGATPESLLRIESRQLVVSCLGGTVSRGADPREDAELARHLLNSLKDRREHANVVEMVTRDLEGLCWGLQWDETPRVMRLKNVQHLTTIFTGRLFEGIDILGLADRLHPTPAVGGTPRQKAMEMIRDLEGDRGWYAAPVGWVDEHGEGEFSIALRCALVRGRNATLFAGSGIVQGSIPEEELQETELKLQPLLTALLGE